MVHFAEMAELMDDNIVHKLFRQMDDAIIKIEIFIRRTASPLRAVIFYKNALPRKPVMGVLDRDTAQDELSRRLFVNIEAAPRPARKIARRFSPESLEMPPDPLALLGNKPLRRPLPDAARHNDRNRAVSSHDNAHAARPDTLPNSIAHSAAFKLQYLRDAYGGLYVFFHTPYNIRYMAKAHKERQLASIAYIIFFLPLFTDKKADSFVRFHMNQAVTLLIAVLALQGIVSILGSFSYDFEALFVWLLRLFVLIMVILGILNASAGRKEALPWIGEYAERLRIFS